VGSSGGSRARGIVAGAALLLAAALAGPADADHRGLNPPWPQLLPGAERHHYIPPSPVKHCPRASIDCVDGLIRRLKRQWRPLDAACDHRAVATLSYLRINQAIRHDMTSEDSLFRHKHWFQSVLTTFSNRYFDAFTRYEEGKRLPPAWQVAFDAQTTGDITAGQDILLFSNAHVQHDLPFAYAEMGLITRNGRSRKHDHDAFNEINNRILDPVGDEVTRRYDPTFPFLDLKPLPVDEIASQEVVKLWREGAWRNAERLYEAETKRRRNHVIAGIDETSESWARLIAGLGFPGLRATRDEYCAAQHDSGAAGLISQR
jgi:hypothetical protein